VPLGEARLGRIGFDEWLRRLHRKSLICIRQPKERVSMKRILCSLLSPPLASAASPPMRRSRRTPRLTLVYQHELPNVPGKRHQGCARRIRPGRLLACPRDPIRLHLTRPCLRGDPQSGQRRTGGDLRGRTRASPSCPATARRFERRLRQGPAKGVRTLSLAPMCRLRDVGWREMSGSVDIGALDTSWKTQHL